MINKKQYISFFTLCFYLFVHTINAQSLSSLVETVASSLQTVEAAKLEYSQSLKLQENNYVNYTLNALDAKGNTNEVVYNFSFADVDVNTVRSLTKKDVIIVQLLINSKQKLIKEISNNGDKISYTDNIAFFAKNIDNARDLVDAIKKIIPTNETLEKNKLALHSYQDHVNWLEKNVQDVDNIKTQIIQKIEGSTKNDGHIKLSATINSKSKTKTIDAEFNLATLNPNSLMYKISGEEFYIQVSNRRNIKAIKVFEDGVQQSYTNIIYFYCSSIENAKDLYKVLSESIPLAEKALEASKPNISSTTNAVSYLNKVIANISSNETSYTQSIEGDCVSKIIVKETTPKGTTDNLYTFNFSDINTDNIDYDSSKTQLFVEINTRKKEKFIRHLKNDELQNYTDSFKIYFENIEDALTAKEALQSITKNCDDYNGAPHVTSVSSGLEALKKEITLVKIGDDNFDQTFEIVSTNPYTVKLTEVFSNLKKSVEGIFEFGLADINPKNIAIVTAGKAAMVELNTNHLEKIIKTYEDGNIKSYSFKLAIQATDIENARNIAALLKQTIEQLK
ncbi:hypothetical protein PK35_03635 [Tamlana nanhaiensis]|uniref:Uncharacterized protein n=1 Tax=Neotamlana nanhaiensis TaxID=1382798 RepID=A0A0D7W573_9FLAO|nr:hypothetical protein [Tamlana nanhaiensis]KJD33848.1 hypothetical protein PK35_03635 [Tamlana nanhaiensis]